MADETAIKAKTVPQLKTLLQAHNLPVTGNKPDLVARVLANPQILKDEAPAASTSAPAASATPATTAAAAAKSSTEPSAGSTAATAPHASTSVDEELERRKKRAERFGTTLEPAAAATDDSKKAERQKRFGTQPADTSAKSVEKIDVALGEGKRGKKAGKDAAATTGGSPAKAAKPAPANVDPEKLAAEEEKKRKRAERFGVADAQPEKKAKTAA